MSARPDSSTRLDRLICRIGEEAERGASYERWDSARTVRTTPTPSPAPSVSNINLYKYLTDISRYNPDHWVSEDHSANQAQGQCQECSLTSPTHHYPSTHLNRTTPIIFPPFWWVRTGSHFSSQCWQYWTNSRRPCPRIWVSSPLCEDPPSDYFQLVPCLLG